MHNKAIAADSNRAKARRRVTNSGRLIHSETGAFLQFSGLCFTDQIIYSWFDTPEQADNILLTLPPSVRGKLTWTRDKGA